MDIHNLTVPSPSTADPELLERAVRRRFSAQEELRVLAAIDAAAGQAGGIGAILRREGLYSSTLSRWRQQRDASVLIALTPAKTTYDNWKFCAPPRASADRTERTPTA